MARSLEEMLRALNVKNASAVVFGKLPNGNSSANREALIFPTGDTFGAFSDSGSIAISFQECAILQAAGAKDGSPTSFSSSNARDLSASK
jgi:hypothetical protein